MAVTLVTCNNKQCRDAEGRREFISPGPDHVEKKTRYPDGKWHHDPDDHLAPPTFEERGNPVTEVLDVHVCPRCGSPTTVSQGTQ